MTCSPFELAARVFIAVFFGLLGLLGMSWLFLPALWNGLCTWFSGDAPDLCYLAALCLVLAFAAGLLVWLHRTLEDLRTAYSAITAKLQTKIDRLEGELAALKQEGAPSQPQSKREA